MTVFRESLAIKMKKRISILTVLAACLAVFCMSCGNSMVKLTYDAGNLIDTVNGITYISAPLCFEPVATELEPYAVCKDPEIELYGIVGCDTDLWLTEKFEGIGAVYYADGEITLPTLSEFEANQIIICIEQTITTAIGNVDDADDIGSIIAAFENGERTTIIPSGEVYKFKFASDKYEGLYYNLVYIEAEDGKNYIYDRSTKICASVGDVMYEYLPR